MKIQKKASPQLSPGVTVGDRKKRLDWVAGMQWEKPHARIQWLRHGAADTHYLLIGHRPHALVGNVSPVRTRNRLFSLAVAFQLCEGGNVWGIYRLSRERDSWVFLAVSNGHLSVMGDVTGTRTEVQAAAENFLFFNDSESGGLRCAARAEDGVDVLVFTSRLTRSQLRRCRLSRRVSPAALALPSLLLISLLGAGWYARDTLSERAKQAADDAAFRARLAMTPAKPAAPASAPHPWAHQLPVPDMLSFCWLTREPLYASVAGWRVTDAECVQQGIRLRYIATPGATVSDFARRVKELFGLDAVFNLQEGGKNGDVFIPARVAPGQFADEKLPGADELLMRFISHLQRRNIDVKFDEVKPPVPVPGQDMKTAPQDWRMFTFIINSRLQPELLFQGLDMTGIRLTSVAISMNEQAKFNYTIKGSVYAQK
ncbi:pilus assembly protein [Pantoea deleyi]|uniref:Pilus assembly protein n=1 Tax=Pantoea deleyi TaxID=470932 RepID=A0A506QU43_9GAMM|nr:type 4b pilus protein PilO2 [Pantoea deleyi]ORM84334.1 pilus assembly protein [Pantoea deleyi]TPV49644.1 pilus assembly protein [Pantoea deleyi]